MDGFVIARGVKFPVLQIFLQLTLSFDSRDPTVCLKRKRYARNMTSHRNEIISSAFM